LEAKDLTISQELSHLERRSKPPLIAFVSLFLLGLLISTAAESLRDYTGLWNKREEARVTSPDGLVDAVLLRPIRYGDRSRISLHVVPHGEPVELSDVMVDGSSFEVAPAIVWARPQLLLMTYDAGCIDDLKTVWHSYWVNGGRYYVELRATASSMFPCLGVGSKPSFSARTPR
jgi:hypothetical protein